MKIYLIGMPGSGKSTLGKKLASELHTEFIDLDDEIESREQQSVTEIFKTKGEDHFRLIESNVLKEFAASPTSFVMATGGGAPCFFQGIDVINDSGVSVFVNVPIETLVKQTAKRSTRPLLQHENETELRTKLNGILEQRLPIYKKARITINDSELATALQALRLTK